MFKITTIFSIVALLTSISGCHDETYHHTTLSPAPQTTPWLDQFDVVDTYGINSEFESTPLAISPYANDGEFEVFWNAFSDYDYFIELRFNTEPTSAGSRLISSELCNPYDDCYNHQYQFCQYTTDLSLSCQSASGDIQGAYIGDMLPFFPQDGFLILEVCDIWFSHCEYQSHYVLME